MTSTSGTPRLAELERDRGRLAAADAQARHAALAAGTAQRAIVAAVAARDATAAAEWMSRHTRDFRRGYEVAGIDLATEVAEALGDARLS